MDKTCTRIKDDLSDRQVWLLQVKNLDRSRAPNVLFHNDAHKLSAEELKNIAVRAAKGAFKWSSTNPTPNAVFLLHLREDRLPPASMLFLLPGGRHVILGTGPNTRFWDVMRETPIVQTASFSSVRHADYADEDNIILVAWAGINLQLQIWNLELSTQSLEFKYRVSRGLDGPRVMLFDRGKFMMFSSNALVIVDYGQQLEIRILYDHVSGLFGIRTKMKTYLYRHNTVYLKIFDT